MTPDSRIDVPTPTAWPMIAAFGITLACAGLVTDALVSVVGVVAMLAGAVGWFRTSYRWKTARRWRWSRRFRSWPPAAR